LRGQRKMLDRIPQWRDKHVRSQWGLFDGISQRRDRHMRGQLNLLDRLQQLFGNVLGQHLSRQRRAGRRVFIEPRLHCGLWLQEPDGRPGWGLFAKHIVLGTQTKCSECGKDVSGKAGTCPNCGAPVAARAEPIGSWAIVVQRPQEAIIFSDETTVSVDVTVY
jgi:hypothetical protein